MKKQITVGIAARFAVAGMLVCAAASRADEIDEMLQAEGPSDQGIEASGDTVEVAAPREPAPSKSSDVELQRARNEIVRLQRALVEQEARHQTDMQRSYYNMGCVYKASKQYERAEGEFLKVLAINPDDAPAHYNLAILYDDDLNLKDKARLHYKKFLALAPDDKDASAVQEWLAALDKK